MVRLTLRILLLLSVLAAGRIVVSGFIQSDERKEVVVVLVPGGNCVSDSSALDDMGGN
jgi:hypothetical protein